ncbi:alcohol dehydrogenase catalytic domain-containing protein [Pelotomaculum propionicicum]|uniref:Putative alcohol dehydrogenase D n=1 Tax=Pelotomaculum propionicicum TaxID=258475 RepID=A0A4Y7RNS0_9FIRM|nr:alcohol dehydrogenase catalytic domain-containing protein [Pelotomaculum propionicicum]TEB10322.1 putative alcohol dehydrogenase D [Pelotomaculum propionicicum]
MRAAICYEFGKPLLIEEVTIEPPGSGEVKIRIAAVGICHSDLHFLKGEHGPAPLPAVGGHEVAGYVEEVGEGVTAVQPGDPVVACLVGSGCGRCYYCTIGLPNFCEKRRIKRTSTKEFLLAGPGHLINKDGVRLTQHAPTFAGFAEYTIVNEDYLVKIDRDMPIDLASLLSCAVISGYGAVVNRAKVPVSSSVVVIGTGGVGLNAIQAASISGAYPVIAVDVLDSKLEAARAFGATHTVNTRKVSDPIEAVINMTYGRGADYVFVSVAGVEVKYQGLKMSGPRGMIVFIGHSKKEPLTPFDSTDVIGGERMITGSAMGALRPRIDIPRLIELYKGGRLKLDELVTARYPFDQINEAIASSERGEALRNVIIF